MDVRIYNGKANSQAGNMKVFLMATQKGQGRKILNLGFQKSSSLMEEINFNTEALSIST